MKKKFLLVVLVGLLAGCRSTKNIKDVSNEIEVNFLHLNDVYEISPLNNGRAGGLARVATVRQSLLKESPNLTTVLAGDFLSPSVMGTLKNDGKTIKGKQMVDVMNAMGIDWVCLGNHEFDYDEKDLQERINESKFSWISTNAFQQKKEGLEPFGKMIDGVKNTFVKTTILSFKNEAGKEVKVGMFGIVLPSNKKNYVWYDDFFETAKKAYEELKPQCDFVVALTHLNKVDDAKLAEILPEVKLLMGGHDHENMLQKIGNVTLAKADANAKTVYIHRFVFNEKTKQVKLTSELKKIDDTIADNEEVAKTVKKWEDIQDIALTKLKIEKNGVIATIKDTLDGRESVVRNVQCRMGSVIAKSLLGASPNKPDCAFFNGGSIRIDDFVIGKITQLDVLRILPYGGKLVELKMRGRLLERILNTGLQNKGSGGYLQWANINYIEAKKEWRILNKALDVNKEYTVVTSDFLFSGKERNLDFFTKENPDILSAIETFPEGDSRNDIRKAVIDYVKK